MKKNGKNPVTGAPLTVKDLVRLHFHKNANGRLHCPLTFKEFNDHSHIVSIAASGNVFSYEAIHELNVKAKVWADQITGEKFLRSDIITLQV